LRLLDATVDAGCRWIFVSSGGTVYGQTDAELIAEDHPTRPISSYGVVKLALEGYFGIYRALHGTDYVVARLANPYGPYQSAAKGQGLVAALLDRMSRGDPVQVWGDGGNVRDYIYIDDATEALIGAAERGLSGEIYNVGSGKGTSVVQLIDAVAAELGRQPLLIRHPARGMDVRRNVLDITKLGTATGWGPLRTLGEGVCLAREWHARQKNNRRETVANEG
jgi:UDP-glucose 4-epimerase